MECAHRREERPKKTHTGHKYNSENVTCQSVLTRKSLIGGMVCDAQLEIQREEYPRAGGKQESIRTPRTLRPAIKLTYCITGLSLRIGITEQRYMYTRAIKALSVYTMVFKGASEYFERNDW